MRTITTTTHVLLTLMAWIMYGIAGNKILELTLGKLHACCVTTRIDRDFTLLCHICVMASQITIPACLLSTQQLVWAINNEKTNKATLIMPHRAIFNSISIEISMFFYRHGCSENAQWNIHRNLFQNRIFQFLSAVLTFSSLLSNRVDILHRAPQYHCLSCSEQI